MSIAKRGNENSEGPKKTSFSSNISFFLKVFLFSNTENRQWTLVKIADGWTNGLPMV